MNATNYRRDIDGLRAVAVLPVLFYHAGGGGGMIYSPAVMSVSIYFSSFPVS